MAHVDEGKDESLELYIVLSRAHIWAEAHSTRHIRRHGLNPTEFGVLELVYHKGPQPLQQIGEKILISSGNITYVVDKLVRKKLLNRVPYPNDRRVIYAELTDNGRKLIQELFPSHTEAIRQAVSGLNPEEKKQAVRLLKKLGKAAQETYK
ncbi:MarR family winged helix-turn-helix transcriptional regulator [Paenibacillus sp. MBLB4367]|uniref:MarR family winged helix-turn-helix transcriptional regulator n=1 Tax=Paenibacillus sp. MBLB4367 TaxID=3384767 RepID=UPI0039084193